MIEIDLYSDTQTRPTPGMRKAMAEAEVGDEQQGRDPTVSALCARVADMLGKDAAVFLPSGTMCNQIALLVHCARGEEVICDRTSHLVNAEAGAGAALAGVMFRLVAGDRGIFEPAQVEDAIRLPGRYAPHSRLLAIEQTTNLGGGAVWPLARLRAVAAVARRRGLATHMDGARLMNAVVASGHSPADLAADMDTVWLDLTKGLGCPVGAVLAGPKDLIAQAWTWKQRLGGAMRQAGILAAAGLYALDRHVARLAEDHETAAELARGLADIPGLAVEPSETNIVFFDVAGTGLTGEAFSKATMALGLRLSLAGPTRMRALTHLDFPRDALPKALEIIRRVAAEGEVSGSIAP
ncbi:MAG: low specificity L-threonine aldolase [Parvibaculaceae bacterium]